MKKLIEIQCTTGYDFKSLWYEDKNIIVEDTIEKDKREISYNITRHAGEVEPPIHNIDKNANIDLITYKYFDYISDGTLPMLKRVSCGEEYSCFFEVEFSNKPFEFKLKFPIDVVVMELGNTILIFYGNREINDPYKFKENLFNEIVFVNDKYLLITDFENKEIYAVNNRYYVIFSGKIDNKGNLIEYINPDTPNKQKISYSIGDKGEILNVYSNKERFLEKKYNHSIVRYALLPYVKTSYGGIMPTNKNEYVLYTYNKSIDDNQINTSIFYDLVTYKEFEKIKESLENDII